MIQPFSVLKDFIKGESPETPLNMNACVNFGDDDEHVGCLLLQYARQCGKTGAFICGFNTINGEPWFDDDTAKFIQEIIDKTPKTFGEVQQYL